MRALLRTCAAAAPLLIGGANAVAQVIAFPESLRVTVMQGQESVASLAMANTGNDPIVFCLDFDRPLQEAVASSFGSGCGATGQILDTFDKGDLGNGWSTYALAVSPDGRLFMAEFAGAHRTYEFTPDLQFVRRFFSPTVNELAIGRTVGITYNEDSGTLWWTNAEVDGLDIRRILLLEGTLDGVATGRRIEIPVPATGPPPTNSGYPHGASYDPSRKRYYYLDVARDELWAVDTLGAVQSGYPIRLLAYPGAHIGQTVDVFGGSVGGPEGVRLEISAGLVVHLDWDRIVVTDALGNNLGLETPLTAFADQGWATVGSTARSRLDPNGVMYLTYIGDNTEGIAAIRPVPLTPSWLAMNDWSGTIPADGSVEITLAFRAGEREPGEFRSTLVVEDTTGTVLASVPLVMEVTPDTPAEPEPAGAGAAMSVAPNPARGPAVATLSLPAPARVRLADYDILGREMDVLVDGPLTPGRHQFAIDREGRPAGVYMLRAVVESDGSAARTLVAHFTLMR